MNQQHCYLFAFEVEPFSDREVYETLPLHCTLMHRFLTDRTPKQIATLVNPIFAHSTPVTILSEKEAIFGPPAVRVNKVILSKPHEALHKSLYAVLKDAGVSFTAPQWVGSGYKAHVTQHGKQQLATGTSVISSAVYLIEVKVPGSDHKKFIRHKFNLKA